MYQFGVNQGKTTREQMCRCLAENPAKLYGLYPRKGAIAPGSDADIVVWNPNVRWTISAKTQQSASDYCPFEGVEITGRAERVYLRGILAAENGEIVNGYGGRYVAGKIERSR